MEDYEILHNFVVLDLFVFPSIAPWYVPCSHYRLSYGGIQIQRSPVGNRHELWRNIDQQSVQPAVLPKANGGQTFSSNLRRFVLANTYLPGPSPAKYFRHDRA